MNYLTNYYKNLSEQLQEKINHLQKLSEAKDMGDGNERFTVRTGIDKVVEVGLRKVRELHLHPNKTDLHHAKLNNLEDFLLSLSDGARTSDASIQDLNGMHDDAHNAMKDIESIEDDLYGKPEHN